MLPISLVSINLQACANYWPGDIEEALEPSVRIQLRDNVEVTLLCIWRALLSTLQSGPRNWIGSGNTKLGKIRLAHGHDRVSARSLHLLLHFLHRPLSFTANEERDYQQVAETERGTV